MDATPEHFNNPNYTYPSFPNVSKKYDSHNSFDNGTKESLNTNFIVFCITGSVICMFGAVGNGIVIWLLGFRIKRNPFMTYILNLAAADLGVLLSVMLATSIVYLHVLGCISFHTYMNASFGLFFPFLLMYSAGQFLLTAISFDRCVALFFPLWHQCKRPPHLSAIVCALIWVLSVLLTAITITLACLNLTIIASIFQFIVNATLCLPVMMIATGALFIKVCLKARQHRRGKLLTIILLSLLFFLLFAFPYNIIYILCAYSSLTLYMIVVALLLACLNSSLNPVIYFLVGRQWKSRRREGMKMILQKVFKEEEGCTEETPVESQV